MTCSPGRDWDSQAYRRWRLAVKRRDKFCCRMCGSRKKLQAHHIRRWADYPELRYQVSNGITLCRKCHGELWNHEDDYIQLFSRMVNPDSFLAVQFMLRKDGKV